MGFVTRLCWIFVLSFTPALADDVQGGRDHPLVGRYEGSAMTYYKSSNFDEAALLQAPHDYNALLERNATKDRSGDDWLKLEGKVTQIRYEGPEGSSSLEIIKNYDAALAAQGFADVFACSDSECLSGKLRDNYLIGEQLDPTNGVSTAYSDKARYLLAKLQRQGRDVYVAVLVGEYQSVVTTFIEVVETGAMQGEKVHTPTAQDMEQAIATEGHIAVYGILFEFDKDVVRPESKPTFDQIAQLLDSNPDMSLNVVGYTDDRGSEQYNLDLSGRRAANVVSILTGYYKINPDRLSFSGEGMANPVADNATEEGRSKNRRVELVRRQ